MKHMSKLNRRRIYGETDRQRQKKQQFISVSFWPLKSEGRKRREREERTVHSVGFQNKRLHWQSDGETHTDLQNDTSNLSRSSWSLLQITDHQIMQEWVQTDN